jgi:hypothetical protein
VTGSCVWRADTLAPDYDRDCWRVRFFPDDATRPSHVLWFDDFENPDGEVAARALAAQVNAGRAHPP